MATETFVAADGQPVEWIVPAGVHSLRAKMRSGGGSHPGWGSQGGGYFEVSLVVVPGNTVYMSAADTMTPDGANDSGRNSTIELTYGRILLIGGWAQNVSHEGPAVEGDPDQRGGFPQLYIEGETRRDGVSSNVNFASDGLYRRGGFGSILGGGGSAASSTAVGVNAVGATGAASGGDGGAGGSIGQTGVFPGGGCGAAEDPAVGAAGSIVIEYFTSHAEDETIYFGRMQQGTELLLVLQCTDYFGTPEDPASIPHVQVYLDAVTPELITSKPMPSDLRRVEPGVFRLSLFLDTLYSTEGRYLVVMKWLDSSGVAHVRAGSFHILPGGSPDGAVISMYSLIRQDAMYMLMQCDSGRLLRKRNPR